jgi:soluble P-type ATPase
MVANISEEALTISQATVSDFHTVHETLHKLQENQENISHAVAQQLTYVKQLFEINGVHAEAIANLSGIIK